MQKFSGHKDTDREILNKLDDKNLLKTCRVNKYFWKEVCNEDFFRNRLLNNYPDIDKEKIKNWKEFYLRSIYYISKMKEDYGYVYAFGDFKKQYNLLKQYSERKNGLLYFSSKEGELALVIWSLKNGANINADNDYALRLASANGHLEVVKYLVEQGADIHTEYDSALRWASQNGYLEVVKFLVEQGANIHAENDYALRWASRDGHLEVVKYLVEQGADIHIRNDEVLRWANTRGHLNIVNYLKTKI